MDYLSEETGVLVANTVYALMNNKFHVSRNERAQWFFRHLNKKIKVAPETAEADPNAEVEILSIYPHDPPRQWNPSTRHNYLYLITQTTNVVYLSAINKAVYCIDMSPSMSAVDIQRGQVMLEEITAALKVSIENVVNPFIVPGTSRLFEPRLFVTVIVHTPFFTTPAQQVLVQGWQVTNENAHEFLSAIFKQLEIMEDTIANVSRIVHDEIDEARRQQAESENLVGGLFEEIPEKQVIGRGISMVGPDSGFINLLRYGMLALRLLPQSNLSNLIVVTDGMINLPDIQVLESVLSQLRSYAVAVSFLHVGSLYHPNCCHGLVPYSDLLQFIAAATVGAYINSPHESFQQTKVGYNLYQEALITWSLRRRKILSDVHVTMKNTAASVSSNLGYEEPHLLSKKHCEEHLSGSLSNVLCCRLHEGYLIKSVHVRDSNLEVVMILPWSYQVYIEYIIKTDWPEKKGSKNIIYYMIFIKAPYSFLNDITTVVTKQFLSPYRQGVASRFWCTLKMLTHTDKFLSHLDSYVENNMAFLTPDNIKNGLPLFYLPANGALRELSASAPSSSPLIQFWKPVVMLEPSVWPKWFHTHRLGIILQPDQPLPHLLHSLSTSSRMPYLQCRLAETALHNCIKKFTAFTLIENHSYIKILPSMEDDSMSPSWFYIVRVTSKPPCAVIHIAFLAGTPGNLRHQVVEAVTDEICKLKFPKRGEAMMRRNDFEAVRGTEISCCTIINKPLEKILIRYERMPGEFGTVVFPDGTQPINAAKPLKPTSALITTLSRYLHHKRSIWDAQTPSTSHNNLLPTMLSTLTRMRLQEGFSLGHCSSGIINMVMEIQMKCYDETSGKDSVGQYQPCIIQYVLFPPHLSTSSMKSSVSGEDTGDESDTELRTELITECWIEPQHGIVTSSGSNCQYTENMHYHQIADNIWKLDAECISTLLTFDYLQLMCHNQDISPPLALDPNSLHNNPLENWPHAVAIQDERIHRIPFAYNLMNLLPKCQQAELLNKMFVQVLSGECPDSARNDSPNSLLMENILSHLQGLHHRELHLSDSESSQLVELIVNRSRDLAEHPLPFATAAEDSGTPARPRLFSHRPKRRMAPIPKWRCFVKSMASSHCVLTFIPASLYDLKLLMLSSETKPFDSQESDSKDSFFFSEYPYSSGTGSPRFTVGVNSKCSSKLDVDSHYSGDDVLYDASLLQTSSVVYESVDEPFRKRSSSWDPVKKNVDESRFDPNRLRTCSVGSKMKPCNIVRTVHEISDDIHWKPNNENLGSFYGSLVLPIYVYDCPLSTLVEALIFKSCYERKPDIYDYVKSYPPDGVGNETTFSPDELDLQYHCSIINQAFDKCFVVALFKSVLLNHTINTNDINIAVQGCSETLLEVDITKYLQTVCGHYKTFTELPIEGIDNACLSPCWPPEVLPLQKLVKQQFLDILSMCFKPIATTSDFFFCCRPPRKAGAGKGDSSCHTTSSQKFDVPFNLSCQSDNEFCHSHNSVLNGTWAQDMMNYSMDDTKLSVLSNVDSDSISDQLMDFSDDLSPLFLHLVCSVLSPDGGLPIANPVKVLPTCFCEFFSSIGETVGSNISSMKVVLGLHCLTIPSAYPVDFPTNVDPADSVNLHYSNLKLDDQSCSNVHINPQLQHLPEHQHKAVFKCMNEIEWFLQDEISTFLLEADPIDESALEFVVNHISNSDGRPTCSTTSVLLDFVYGPENSLEKFIQEFSNSKVGNYQLDKIGDLYYMIKSDLPKIDSSSHSTPKLSNHSGDEEHDFFGKCSENGAKKSTWCSTDKAFQKFKWILELEKHRPRNPNFWLIVKIYDLKVTVYFHCKFFELPIDEVQHCKEIHLQVLDHIEAVCKTVNQTLLLNSLHETRMCDPLLEPEEPELVWKPDPYMKYNEDIGDVYTNENSSFDIMNKFQPGWFSCNVVWQAHFILHPRLKTGPGKPGLSRAIQALRTILNRFSVNNRTNMFVYQDSSGSNVFYLRLHENICYLNRSGNIGEDISPGSVSRSSSVSSLTFRRSLDESCNKEARPRLKSFGENFDSTYHQKDILTLRVHGISDAGGEITHELVQVLQNRLDDAVLDVVSVMLARNPMCKLTPDDVHFIQKPHLQAAHIIQFTIPITAHSSLEALAFYLKQNVPHFFFSPKYTDSRHTFSDYSQCEGSSKRINEPNIYLYNQSPVSGHKGIACLGIAIVDIDGSIVSNKELTSNFISCDKQVLNSAAFNDIQIKEIEDHDEYTDFNIVMEVRVWKQGRVNMDILLQKLKNVLQYSLWDLITEYNIVNTPIKENISDDMDEPVLTNNNFFEVVTAWFQYGYELSVPAMKIYSIDLSTRHSIGITVREMKHIISLHETSTYVFMEEAGQRIVFKSVDDFESSLTLKCYIVSTSASHYVAEPCENIVHENYQAGGCLKFIPRQRFLMSIITSQKVLVFVYNWSKDRVEDLTKMISQLGVWLSTRSAFLTGLLSQKMGIFHIPPFGGKMVSQLSTNNNMDLESLSMFSPNSTPRKTSLCTVSSTSSVFKDPEVIAFNVTKNMLPDPVCANIEQVADIKAADQKELQEKLYIMWQSRGIGQFGHPSSDDVHELFIKNSRIFHFCLIPFLFHPKWRFKSVSSGDSNPLLNLADAKPEENTWHQQMYNQFINDYKQHLQSVGFSLMQPSLSSTPRKSKKYEKLLKIGEDSTVYMQKSMIGGVIMMQINLLEPFIQIKVHGIECTRLQQKSHSNMILQVALSFLEECRKMTSSMFLHSFAYDFHLKSLEAYITSEQSPLPQGYRVISFLDDFISFYPIIPESVCTLLNVDNFVSSNLSTPPTQLFDFLLGHAQDYGMDVLHTVPADIVPYNSVHKTPQENEFVLVKYKFDVSKYPLSKCSNEAFNNVKLTLVITFDKASVNVMNLKYFVILTCSRVEPVLQSGYFSNQDQVLVGLMTSVSSELKIHVEDIISKSSMDCRIHLLWNRLLSNTPSNTLPYSGLFELKRLAHIEVFTEVDKSLKTLLLQPFPWYQGLVRVLNNKYSVDKCKMFTSPDNTLHHILIVHPRFVDGFVMLALDLSVSHGELSIIFRQTDHEKREKENESIYNLFEGVVNACCFHLWTSLLSN